MATLTQGAAPNIVSANIYEERSGTLLTAQVADTALMTANVLASRSYTIVAPTATPSTGQIAIGGLQAGDIVIGVGPTTVGTTTIAATATLVSGTVTSATTISLTWANTAASAPVTGVGPISLLVYRPVTSNAPKTSFDG